MATREQLLMAVAGKAIERGLTPEQDETGEILSLHYPEGTTDREDILHKQAVRSLIGRIAPDWKIHILSIENGLSVEVRPKPGSREAQPSSPASAQETEQSSTGEVSEKLDTVIRLMEEIRAAV